MSFATARSAANRTGRSAGPTHPDPTTGLRPTRSTIEGTARGRASNGNVPGRSDGDQGEPKKRAGNNDAAVKGGRVR